MTDSRTWTCPRLGTDYQTWTCPRCGIDLCDDPLCGCEAGHDEWCKP